MRNAFWMLFLLFLAGATPAIAQTFTLKSADLGGQATNKQVFNGFGCSGENVSPQLSWEHAPEGTQSFAITMYDPDAPTGSGWWHWVLFDLPASLTQLPGNAGDPEADLTPEGAVQSMTNFGQVGYGGPCPPAGDAPHRYIITVYALSTEKLGLDENANPALVGFNLNANAIQKASIIFYHGRE